MFKKYRNIVAALILAALMTGITGGCSRNQQETGNTKSLTIKGSDTMVHLVTAWAEAYMKVHPNAEISVTGGGSGTGIAALLNGTTDLCAASRKIKPKEVELAESKSIFPKEFVVGRDGIAVVVNPDNSINDLSMEQLKKIFTGAYTNWSQVKGEKEKIVVLSRESNSGTYVFFQKTVLKKEDYTAEALLMPASSSIIQSVSVDKTSIGYIGLGYALDAGEKVKIVNIINDNSTDPVSPTMETVKNGSYPIARPLHLYTDGKPSVIAQTFIEFCNSAEGQKIVVETGYIPL
ncbi:MAG: phosphate ABC transporter substrate-binding protein [Candidatus Electryonea clarkiae]|nr:phosphate ABC transporter substrate-binding protein [Candidatus Electryonea clarkiae]MDP8288312.1 phosphate ABC transporter substrate-binding protein [Candidatus Electryonea clarkiae]